MALKVPCVGVPSDLLKKFLEPLSSRNSGMIVRLLPTLQMAERVRSITFRPGVWPSLMEKNHSG